HHAHAPDAGGALRRRHDGTGTWQTPRGAVASLLGRSDYSRPADGVLRVIDSLAVWLQQTRLSTFVLSSPWIWATLETLHFIGLAVLIGTAGLLDLRLMGFFRGLPVAPLRRLFPWMIGAFAVNVVTGVMFFTGSPLQYAHNLAFGLKLLFITVAGL